MHLPPMKRRIINFLLLITALCSYQFEATAQTARPFWNEIKDFQKQDSLSMPKKHGIVFLGSSSFRMWKDAETTFKSYKVINRGFGGSTLTDAINYVDYLVAPYQPRQVVIYSGENDIASGAGAEETFRRLKTLAEKIREKQPEVPLVYVSMKESPSRVKFRDSLLKANDLIKSYVRRLPKAVYVDVNAKMLNKDGSTRSELFREDMLHMKKAGYDIWEKAIRPLLLKP
jgi:lysophospholipase L1-like esterase